MSALWWIWIGGMAPVAFLAACDRRHGRPDDDDADDGRTIPLWAWAIGALLWPVFVIDAGVMAWRGRL